MASLRLGEMLVRDGRIDAAQLSSALAHQRVWGGRLGRAIVHLGFMTEAELLEEVSRHLGVPFIHIGDRVIPPHVLALVPERIMRGRRVLPLARLSERPRGPLAVALSEPGDLGMVDEIGFATGMDVKPVLAAERDLERAISRHLDGVELPETSEFEARDDAIELDDGRDPPAPRGSQRDPSGGTSA